MDFIGQTLPSVKGTPLLPLSFLLPPLEWALLLPAEEAFPVFSATLVVMASLISVSAAWVLIPPVLVVPLVFLLLFYSPFSFCIKQ